MATAAALQRTKPTAEPATRAQTSWLADVFARSFWDDPVFSWLHPSDRTRYAALRRFFRAEIAVNLKVGRVLTTPDLGAVAVWSKPNHWKAGPAEMVRMAPAGLLLASRPIVGAKFFQEMERTHPVEPHWYLATVGSDPNRKGTGAGQAVIEPVLTDCDRDRIPAYLESSKLENVSYYERFGFEVTGEIQVADSPKLYPMWRNPA